MSLPEATTPARPESLLSRFLRLRRGPWEWVATIIIAQPSSVAAVPSRVSR